MNDCTELLAREYIDGFITGMLISVLILLVGSMFVGRRG